mgnify:FL=1
MFFVLSGRLMAEILFIKQAELSTFLKRRISRVWPALMVFIIIVSIAFHFTQGSLFVSGKSAISALTFTYNYAQLWLPRSHVLDHIWSLCIEEHVYLLLAIIAYYCRKTLRDPIPILFTISALLMLNGMVQTWMLHGSYNEVYWRTDTRGASIIVSCAIFLLLNKKNYTAPSWLPVTTIIGGILFSFQEVPDPIKYSLGSTLMAIGLCTIKRLPSPLLNILESKPFLSLGLISFSLYLWQQPMYKLYENGWNKYLMIASAFVLSYASYKLIEGPARRFINTTWAKQ